MYWLYSLFLVAWGVLLLPFFLWRLWRRKKTLPGIAQRFGRIPPALRHDGRATVWFHSCSVGETLSVVPLAESLRQSHPELRLVFSTITATGQRVAKQSFERYGAETFYFPVDLAWTARRVLRAIRPVLLVIIDTEIWPNVLRQARLRGIPVILANGRISARSFPYYRRARPVLRRVLANYSLLLMQSAEDAARIIRMGAPKEKVAVTGNIKFDRDLVEAKDAETVRESLGRDFGLGGLDAPLVVAGSTHPGEDEMLLEALRVVRNAPGLGRTKLLLAPRHPERFDPVAALATACGYAVRRRSTGGAPAGGADVYVLDTLGELSSVYAFATVVFVGGTLTGHGGHSVMEPALHAKPIVVGPSMENFRAVADEFRCAGGMRQLSGSGPDELRQVLIQLLQDPPEREALGRTAFSILEQNRGAARRTMDRVFPVLEAAAGMMKRP